jgi:aminobenzoyl-glutamate transport protein
MTPMTQAAAVLEAPEVKKRSLMDGLLDGVETLGNKVPHPVMMFVYLIVFVIVLSAVLALLGVSVTEQILEPVPYPVPHDFYADTTQIQSMPPQDALEWSDTHFEMREETIPIKGLLTIEGIRFLFTSFVPNFQNFGVIAVMFIAMMGAAWAAQVGRFGGIDS